jgi:hypothetical protein
VDDFADGFNTSAIGFIEEVVDYEEVLQEVEDANFLGEQLVNLVSNLLKWMIHNQRGWPYVQATL